ncbi:MAG TPA: helix-turn-helix domain-containing protein [Candidatus Sulfotelmatobacter sp.]|jgi:AcrR family transcriptional regulator|nr:helix-turn-helix domain-containing protein [Candidatus Sulfotelmatobacter sp.]
MPRKPDVALEGKIVDVAYRLWSEHGEAALTMRAVARAAKTTTPTVYQRFRDKTDLRHFLEERARQKMFDALRSADTPIEICRKALEFISGHINEYRLLSSDWGTRFAQKMPMRSFDYFAEAVAKDLGSTTEDPKELAFQLFALVHGTALLRPIGKEREKTAEALNGACLKACTVLLRDAARRKKNRPAQATG